ncbi:DUF2441 domain-containing protein [Mucilaginibacter sp. P25]|uniref:Uncharacterized protein n=1 Tax=Mucilaginibacter gossypii TaxID=551996 RepID=A0A1G8MFT3_9SPHI|nr:DUF2441 domain-containing protein [Mucilaginibacter gossypii]SDI66878.1 Protein of unknown function [Mucilaginibacter gossypii]
MKLFTVDRAQTLNEGLTISLTKEDPHNIKLWGVENLLDEESLKKHIQRLYPEGMSNHGWYYLNQRHTFGTYPNFTHHIHIITEANVEHVRQAYFSSFTSRFQSLFACGSIQDALKLRTQFKSEDSPIFELETNFFRKLDMNWLFFGTQNITSPYLAHQYWEGKESLNPFWEYCVELPVTIGQRVA